MWEAGNAGSFSLRLADQSKLDGSCMALSCIALLRVWPLPKCRRGPLSRGKCPSATEARCHRDRKTHGQASPASSLAISRIKTCSRKEQAQDSMWEPLGGAGECTGQSSLEEQLIEEEHAGKGFSQWLTGCDRGSPAMAAPHWRGQGPVIAEQS